MLKKKLKIWSFIKDPIYGYIPITDEERKIIDTRTFQRLHRINQLPLAYLVYPAAVHTRFEHSLGVLHISNLIADYLPVEVSEEEAKIVRISALLHDIGHGPFSHLFEYISLKNFGLNHEEIGKIIINNSEIKDVLKEIGIDPKIVGNLITGEKISFKKYLQQIIKSGIDADKLDFIKRDNFHSGAGYGNIDIDRLVTTMEVYNNNLAINMTSLLTFELFLIARIKSFEAIYFHKTLRAAQLMLIKALNDTFNELGILKKFNIDEYIKLDDYRAWIFLSYSKKNKKILERIEKRDLLKVAYEKKFIMKFKTDEFMKKLNELKEDLIKLSGLSNEEIYFDVSTLPSVPYHNAYSYDPFEIPIVKSNGEKQVYKLSLISPWIESLKGFINIFRIYTENKYKEKVYKISKKLIEENLFI